MFPWPTCFRYVNPKTSLNRRAELLKRTETIKYAHKCTPIKRKRYRDRGDLSTFCLELIQNQKASLVIKFRSETQASLEPLRAHLILLVQTARLEQRE